MRKFYLKPVLKLMLALTFFLQFTLQGFAAEAQTIKDTNISFTANNLTLKEVFRIIEKKSSFVIGYDNVIDTKKRVSLTVKDKTVYDVLRQLLKDYKGSVSQVDDYHVLIKVEKEKQVESAPVAVATKPAVQVQVTGTVTDTKNEPLPAIRYWILLI